LEEKQERWSFVVPVALESRAFGRLRKLAIAKRRHLSEKTKKKEIVEVGDEQKKRRMRTDRRISTRTVSMLLLWFQLVRTGSLVFSTLPSVCETKGRLTREMNWIVGGTSGY
jgi:hypothetical protein